MARPKKNSQIQSYQRRRHSRRVGDVECSDWFTLVFVDISTVSNFDDVDDQFIINDLV